MKTLPEGTEKYLMFHPDVVERNTERAKTGDPIVVVIEVGEDGKQTKHHGYNALTEGGVTVHYSQRDPLFKVRFAPHEEDVTVNAAYYTRSAVQIAEDPDEVLMFEDKSTTEEPEASTASKADTKKGKNA